MFRRKTQHTTQVPGLQGPTGPKGDQGKHGPEGRDWTHQVATWAPLPEAEAPEVDMVNHPAHYENHPIFPGECWDYTKWLTPAQYAAAKYLWRYSAKGDPAENLQKALWYMVHAEDGFDAPMMVNLRDVPGGADLYNRLDAALTTAEVGVLRQRVDIPVSNLYAGMAFLHVIRGQIDAAMSSTESALDRLD